VQRANEQHSNNGLVMTRRSLLLALPILPAALSTQQISFASEADRLTDLTQKTFWDRQSAMYRAPVASAETVASDPQHDRGYVLWPSIEMLHALVEGEMARHGRYRARIAEVYDGLEKYRNAEAHAYNAWLDFPGNVDRYYDDNAIVARVLMKAYRVTHDRRYLDRARDVLDGFVRQGWDASDSPGGMHWGFDPANRASRERAACSTCMTALAALEMASAGIERKRYIEWTEALMDWLMRRLQDSDGLICDALEPPNWNVRRVKWTYNTGMAIHVHVVLWRMTRSKARLEAARAMADAATNRSGALYDSLVKDPDKNHWFDSSFFVPYLAEGLVELSRATRERKYADEARRNALFAHAYVRDPDDGLYFRNWRLWRIDRKRWEIWRELTGGTHPLEADWDERSKEPDALKRPEAERPVVKTLLANAGTARLFRIIARA